MKLVCCLIAAALANEDRLELLQTRAVVHSLEGVEVNPEDFCTDEKLVLNEPKSKDITGQGIRYPNVKDGVDLVITAGEGYEVHKEKFNGLYKGFGSINMMSGSATELTFKFVQTGTDNPVQMPKVSVTWYDLDEGQEGRSRGSLETCDAAGSFLPATTELSQVRGGNGCYKTSTCKFGRKGNGPKSINDISADAFSRTVTYSYSSKSEFKVRLGSAAGFNGRNYQFSLDPINACKMTTTTTTAGPQPLCNLPAGGHTICNMRQDPYADRVFAGAGGFMRSYGVHRMARSTDGSIEVQSFTCPVNKQAGQIAIICGLAVKVGDTTVTYVPSATQRTFKPKVTVNGVNQPVTSSQRTDDASILPAPVAQNGVLLPFSSETDIMCVHDNDAKFTISMGERSGHNAGFGGPNFFEIDWKIFMNDAVIDKSATWCGLGINAVGEQARIPMHDLEQNLFSAKEVDFLCKNLMGAQPCQDWEDKLAFDVNSNQDLCEATGTEYQKAFDACRGFANPKVENACIFEYCQDGGKGKHRQEAQEGEDNLEEGDLEVANIHDRDFTPDECCEDDPDCDKSIKLAR